MGHAGRDVQGRCAVDDGRIPRLCDDSAVSNRRQADEPQLERLGFGCVKLGSASGANSASAAKRLIRAAVHAGVTFFDTADAYGSGASERILARRAFGSKQRGRRDQGRLRVQRSLVARARSPTAPRTCARQGSIGASRADNGIGCGDASAVRRTGLHTRVLRGAVDASLRRLQTDYIDLYQLHGPAALCSDETLELMDDLVRSRQDSQVRSRVGARREALRTGRRCGTSRACSCHSGSSIPKRWRCSRPHNTQA